MSVLPDIDFADPDLYVPGVPHEAFARLREDEPVSWREERDGTGYWALTRFDDIADVSRRPETFSSAHEWGGHRIFNEHEVGVAGAGESTFGVPFISRDPPIHTKYRKFVMPAVAPVRIDGIEARIRERVENLVANIPFDEAVDMLDLLNAPLPLLTLAEVIGVSPDLWPDLFRWTNVFIGEDDPEFRQSPEDLERNVGEFLGFCQELFNTRRANPTNDMASLLANADVYDGPMPFAEFSANMVLTLVGGNETTRNTLSQTMLRFAEQPDQWDLVRADPTILRTGAREMVRHACAVYHMRRTATHDVELQGKPIKRGDKVLMWYVAGNRDPRAFDNPDKFDLGRGNVQHLAFGSGQHICVGSRLAEMQLRVAFEVLAKHVKSWEVIEEPKRMRSNFINGVKTLKLRLNS